MSFSFKLATKANHKQGNSGAREVADLSFSGKTLRFSLSKKFFTESGISGNKSLSWVEEPIDGKAFVFSMSGNTGLTLKNSERGNKGKGFTAATLVEVLQSAGLLPATITEDTKAKFDLTLVQEEIGIENVLEGYEVVASEKADDEDEDEVAASSTPALEEVEEVEETVLEADSFGDDI